MPDEPVAEPIAEEAAVEPDHIRAGREAEAAVVRVSAAMAGDEPEAGSATEEPDHIAAGRAAEAAVIDAVRGMTSAGQSSH